MTKIIYNTSEKGFEIDATGHAGYVHSGPDIVCAAVSVLLQTLLLRVMDVTTDYKYKMDKGYMYIKADGAKEVRDAFDTILIGLQSLESEYPAHVEVVAGGCPIITDTNMQT